MADTDIETLQNGTATLSLEEEERLKQRPADIDADVREMERRKRVEALMSSKLFREELERVLDQQMHEGGDAPLLQRIREMVGGRLHSGSLRGPTCVLPINDIRGIEGVGYEKGEKILRCKLAAVYRLVDLFGWTQTGVNGQITARLNTAVESVLTTPRGLLPHEVTASSLVKVDMQGAVQDQGTTNFPVNVEGFSLHAAVHSARPDIRCVLHVRSASTLAVSCMAGGLLPLCYEAAALGDCVVHRVPLGILDNEEKDKLVRALGPSSKILILSNSGALCCGATLEEAFHHARLLTAAADVQLRLASIPMDRLAIIDEETRRQIFEAAHKPPNEQGKWRVGGEEFEALMRMLDNAGFRTGYIYRHPLIKNDVPKPKNDVEVPPAVSSLGYLLEEEELYKQGIWKKGQGKTGERTRWLNSPNVYQKVEVLETGTHDPKKITKWVDANNDEDGSPAHSSTPVRIDTLQFVPMKTNPKEFKKLQQQIKENRRADKISAGPQSHILEGVTWDEASKLVGEDAVNTQTGDHVVLMGAASKGIIQRGYQHNATVYSAPYARNPFDHVTDNEIEDYKRAVERKRRGNDYDTDLSESEAISGAQITSPASARSDTEEESRDEPRVLRIETTQAPIRSQPEVVLSDVDTTDFLNAERSHADRTKDTRDPTVLSDDDVFLPSPRGPIVSRAHHRDPNLLSDDEVFLDSTASATSSTGLVSPPPTRSVVIRAQTTAVAQSVRGDSNEALSSSKRSLHEYTRNTNFDSIVKIYDSPEAKTHPKCKLSLSYKLDNAAHATSQTSLSSIPSLEWDGRCKSDYGTKSLPRQRSRFSKLYRTRSHSGFINSYLRDPEPLHYHLPRCRSSGSVNTHSLKEDLFSKNKLHTSLYLSVDNIHQKCNEESEKVKVKETILPVLKVAQAPEFVESQEFNEDTYLGELNSFSSANQTVINKADVTVTQEIQNNNEAIDDDSSATYRAEYAEIENDENDNTLEASEGEYHSFTDDFEEAYESPVKDLVEKDIRDYSVPINFYCDDYNRKNDSPKKSPFKCRDVPKNALEPILEESKSSYGDDSGNLLQEKRDSDVHSVAEKTTDDVIDAAVIAVQSNVDNEVRDEISCEKVKQKMDTETQTEEITYVAESEDNTNLPNIVEIVKMHVDNTEEDENVIVPLDKENCVIEFEVKNKNSNTLTEESSEEVHLNYNDPNKDVRSFDNDKCVENKDARKSSIDYSEVSSTIGTVSFNSTVEFEKYEAISDLLGHLLNKIDYNRTDQEFFNLGAKKYYSIDLLEGKCVEEVTKKVDNDTGSETSIFENVDKHFSITKMIQEFEEQTVNLNESVLTEMSDSGITEPFKVAESLLYYIFDRVFVIENDKNKKRNNKRVVTVVDVEDIMYTAVSIWPEPDENENYEIRIHFEDQQNNFNLELYDREVDQNNINAEQNKSDEEHKDFEEEHDDFSVVAQSNCDVILERHIVHNQRALHEIDFSEFNKDDYYTANFAATNETIQNISKEKYEELSHYNDEHIPVDKECKDYDNNIETSDNVSFDKQNYHFGENYSKYEEEAEIELGITVPQNNYDANSDEEHAVKENTIKSFELILMNSLNSVNLRQNSEYNKDDYSTTDDEECKELSENSIEIAEDIVFEVFNSASQINNDVSVTYEEINTKTDEDTTNNDQTTLDDQSDDLDEVITGEIDDVNATFIEKDDRMNTAFVQDEFHSLASSPRKDTKMFDACDESPIHKPNTSFVGQDLSILYTKDDTLLGSPFVKQAAVISMSQTENAGGIKYWLSFDESFTRHNDLTYIRSSLKNTDDTIPSFYGIEFENDQVNVKDNHRKSILINEENNTETDEEARKVCETPDLTSPGSSYLYDTCNTTLIDDSNIKYDFDSSQKRYDFDSQVYDDGSQKKLLYEVQRSRDRLYSTWPPFEDTLFYRIISKFRMSESFDSSELDRARINSL